MEKNALPAEKNNHFANKCHTPSRPEKRSLHNVDYEVFTTTRTSHLKESELVTLRLESGNYMRFQPDTGAQCNVIPVELYKKATTDHNLERVEPIRTPPVAYGGTRLNVVGHVELLVERNNTKYKIACKLVDEDSRPLLGRKACISMNIVKYIDNDEIAADATQRASLYS